MGSEMIVYSSYATLYCRSRFSSCPAIRTEPRKYLPGSWKTGKGAIPAWATEQQEVTKTWKVATGITS